MAKQSAGILLYRLHYGELQVLMGHMGEPRHAHKQAGSWSIPKGELEKGEDAQVAALREFEEEVGFKPTGALLPLTSITQKSGKRVHAWAIRGDFDVTLLRSNLFRMEWPKDSGQFHEFAELASVAWLTVAEASRLAIDGQGPLFADLEKLVGGKEPLRR